MADDASQLRQRILALHGQRSDRLDSLLGERSGLIRGTVGTRARVCGNPGCHCTTGALHESKYLSAAVSGKTRQVHVPQRDEVMVTNAVERYQRFRQSRSELSRLDAELQRLLDALCVALLAQYPPDDPIPPPSKRGRKPSVKKRRGRR